MSAEFKTRVLADIPQLRAIGDEWDGLYARCPGATPFQHPEWIISWAEISLPERISVIEVRSGNMLVGLAPFLIYSRGEERVLAFMAGGISDYLDVLVDPQRECEIVLAIFQAIQELDCWTTLDLTDLPANSVLHRTVVGELVNPHDQCSSLLLPKTREELLQHFSKRQRANLRQAHSRIRKAGQARVETATAETLTEFLDDLFRLHAMRWLLDGQPGVLANEKVKAFHRKAAPRLLAKGILRLYRLRIRDYTTAVVYTLLNRATVFCYLQGYDPEFAELSPGTYLMFSMMEEAMLAGANKFDLLRGQEGYKQHWRAEGETTYRIQLFRTCEAISRRLDSAAA
jgi:CelD/BcsL family acetyltransferase involved in cellulose biosynthesis